jgi:Fe-S cluster assembly ATP-binding protein
MSEFVIRNLHASIDDREILKGVNLTVTQGEVHALMGPNGTGKSTLAYVLMGHPSYQVTEGEVWFKGQNILELSPDVRAHLGVFLAFQYPVAFPELQLLTNPTAINAQRKAANPQDKGIPCLNFGVC